MGGKKGQKIVGVFLIQITNDFNHIGLNLDTTFDGKIENVVVREIYIYNVLHKICTNCKNNENTFDRNKKG